jgi:Tol biopolymer transport system component
LGNRIATSFLDETSALSARIWDAETGRPVGFPLRHTNWVKAMCFSPDGKMLATSDFVASRVHFWNADTGTRIGLPLAQKTFVLDLAFSPDGKTLAVGQGGNESGSSRTILWDVAQRAPRCEDIPGYNTNIRFSPDGSALLASDSRSYRLHDSASGRPLGPPIHQDTPILIADFSPDGKYVVFGLIDGSLRVLDPTSGQQSGQLMFHTSPVQTAAFSPDSEGRLLLAGCADGTAWLWDRASSRPLGPPFVHGKDLVAVAFRPDGQTIVTTASDGSTFTWPIPRPLGGSSEQIAMQLQVRTALEHSVDQDLRRLSAAEWKNRITALEKLNGTLDGAYAGALSDRHWHQSRAREAEREGKDYELLWHLDRLEPADVSDGAAGSAAPWLLPARRARAHSQAGRLSQASAEYDRASALAPPGRLGDWYLHRIADCLTAKNWETLLWYADRADAECQGEAEIDLGRARA